MLQKYFNEEVYFAYFCRQLSTLAPRAIAASTHPYSVKM